MYPHRGIGTSHRFLELLDTLKGEFESLAHEVNVSKIQRDEYERQLQTLLGELTSMQNILHDLERKHSKLKLQYEDEINRLKSQDNNYVNNNNSGVDGFSSVRQEAKPIFSQDSATLTNNTNNANNINNNNNNNSNIGKRPIPPKVLENPNHKIQKVDEEDRGVTKSPPREPIENEKIAPSPSREERLNEKNNINNNNNTPNAIANFGNLLHVSNHNATNLPISNTGNDNNHHSSNPLLYSNTINSSVTSISSFNQNATSPTTTPESQNIVITLRTPETQSSNGEAHDWKYGYNPNTQTDLGVDLAHTFENNSVVCCVRFSNDGKNLVTGCNRKAQVFNVATGEKVHTFTDSNAKEGDLYLRSVCFSPDGKYLACGAEDKTVKLWNIEESESKVFHSFVGHTMDIYSLDYSKDGRFIVSGSGDKKVRIWDVEKKKCYFTLGNDEVGPKDGVTSVAISPDGRLVAAGSLDKIVRLWDVQTGYFLERYEGHTDSVYSVAFSPDGNSLASGSLDKTLKLWDISETRSRSKCRSTFTGHTDFVLSVAFSPDGNWLISGSKDRSVQFWDPRSAVTHMKLEGHKNSVISVAVNPVAGTFATGSGDMKAKIWKYNNAPPLGP